MWLSVYSSACLFDLHRHHQLALTFSLHSHSMFKVVLLYFFVQLFVYYIYLNITYNLSSEQERKICQLLPLSLPLLFIDLIKLLYCYFRWLGLTVQVKHSIILNVFLYYILTNIIKMWRIVTLIDAAAFHSCTLCNLYNYKLYIQLQAIYTSICSKEHMINFI